MKLISKRNLMQLMFIICLLMLMNSQSVYSKPGSDDNSVDQVPPNIKIVEIVMDNTLPEDGDTVKASISIINEDSQNYSNLRVQITLTKLLTEGRTEDPIDLGNEVISILNAGESIIIEVEFTVNSGQFLLTSLVFYNNLPITNSILTANLQVLSPPFGDNITPLMALVSLVLFFLIFLLFQAFYDYYRLHKINKK